MSIICRSIAVLLSALLVLGPTLDAQTPATGADPSIQELHLRVVEGGGAEYKVGSLSDQSLVVAVTDQNGAPVPSAAVLFRLPDEGATGAFTDGTRVIIAYSDMQGLAVVRNIQWGSTPGTVVLRITATKGAAHAGILAPETLIAGGRSRRPKAPAENPPPTMKPAQPKPVAAVPAPAPQAAIPPPAESALHPAAPPAVSIVTDSKESVHSGSKRWLWIALIGAGAAAGAIAAGGGSHSSAGSGSTASLTIGNPSVGIGRP